MLELTNAEEIYPIVKSPLLRKKRKGKGFSLKELATVGLTIEEARKLSIPVDKRRKSTHEENIRILKEILKKV